MRSDDRPHGLGIFGDFDQMAVAPASQEEFCRYVSKVLAGLSREAHEADLPLVAYLLDLARMEANLKAGVPETDSDASNT